jgi:hypothetical protein
MLAPDTAIADPASGVTVRWLDHVRSAVPAASWRCRALRAVRPAMPTWSRNADFTNRVDSFRRYRKLKAWLRACRVPYNSVDRQQRCISHLYYMRTYGARGTSAICVLNDNALGYPLRCSKEADIGIFERRLIADPIRLFDCVMPCAGRKRFGHDAAARLALGPAVRGSAFHVRTA